jgi:pimeloyl-ACP methyl ester carboxylesterase
MTFADLTSTRLFYSDTGGHRPPVLFVHGFSCDSHDWSWQLPVFGERFRVIAADNRGHGRSSLSETGYGPHEIAEDIVELLKLIDAGPAVVVGHSMGAAIGSIVAVEHPHLVRALVMVDPAYSLGEAEAQHFIPMFTAETPEQIVEAATAALGAQEAETTPAGLREWHRRRALGLPAAVASGLLGDSSSSDWLGWRQPEYLSRRRCPILGICTSAEKAAVDAAVQNHPDSRQLTWEGTGHWLHQERPDEFNNTVLGWLDSL